MDKKSEVADIMALLEPVRDLGRLAGQIGAPFTVTVSDDVVPFSVDLYRVQSVLDTGEDMLPTRESYEPLDSFDAFVQTAMCWKALVVDPRLRLAFEWDMDDSDSDPVVQVVIVDTVQATTAELRGKTVHVPLTAQEDVDAFGQAVQLLQWVVRAANDVLGLTTATEAGVDAK